MLSNPAASNLRPSRQHRRTQSTLAAPYPTTEASTMANPNIQRLSAHRRGISLDNRRPASAQDQYRGNNTNAAFNNQQHSNQYFYNPINEENYLISPSQTPQRQSFDGSNRNSLDGGSLMDIYGAPIQQQQQYPQFTDTLQLTRPVTADGNMNANQFSNNDFYSQESGAITPSAYIDFTQALEGLSDDWNSTIKPVSRPTSRPLSRNFARVPNPQFEALSAGASSSRQLTPPSANSSSYFPSPANTPFTGAVKPNSGSMLRRFQDDYDTSLEETIRPSRRSSPSKSNFQQMREQAEHSNIDSAKMPPSAYFAPPLPQLPPRSSSQLSNYDSPYHSESDTRSEQNSPQLFKKQMYNDPFTARIMQSAYPELSGSEASRENSPDRNYAARQRTLSVISLSSHTSELNPDETIQSTGISLDDISQYISGPSPTDAKYICLYPLCSKRFGRKENIKSHVQTHLGDRQFQCPHCSKCFVRQHDLKRHAKIHSGVKPYPCACGNSFARHDALTRHRQRGMCVGAFEGVVKKVVKRGRPRKMRPDEEERVGKAEESRSRARVKKERSNTMDSSCSESDFSRSSYSMSPAPSQYRSVEASPFEDINRQPFSVTDSATFPDFVTTNPFRDEAQQQAELDRISRNLFGDDQPPEFKYGVGIGGHLQVPNGAGGGTIKGNVVGGGSISPQMVMSEPAGYDTGTVKGYNTETIKAYNLETVKASGSRSVNSNPSPPGLSESFHGSSPVLYDGGGAVDTDMFLDFGDDTSSALAQEATLLSLGPGSNKGFGDSLGEFGVDLDVNPADISLFNDDGNSWLK